MAIFGEQRTGCIVGALGASVILTITYKNVEIDGCHEVTSERFERDRVTRDVPSQLCVVLCSFSASSLSLPLA